MRMDVNDKVHMLRGQLLTVAAQVAGPIARVDADSSEGWQKTGGQLLMSFILPTACFLSEF